jgi:hypothetical protein
MWFELIEETYASRYHSSSSSTDPVQILTVSLPQQPPSGVCCSALGRIDGLFKVHAFHVPILFQLLHYAVFIDREDRVIFLTHFLLLYYNFCFGFIVGEPTSF